MFCEAFEESFIHQILLRCIAVHGHPNNHITHSELDAITFHEPYIGGGSVGVPSSF